MQTLSNHVFATLTFSRDKTVRDCWESTGTLFNRYIQRLRRLHTGNQVHYIRAIEAHMDSYPHIHAVFKFGFPITVYNARYFDKLLYQNWKQLWPIGLSDYQPPRSQRQPLLYLIKYISKDTHTYRTLWKHLFSNAIVPATTAKDTDSSQTTTPAKTASTPIPITPSLTLEYCKKYKVKQLSWSRGFFRNSSCPEGTQTLISDTYN